MADQFSLQFATACEGWLLPALQGFLLGYKTKQTEKPGEKTAEIHHSGGLKMLLNAWPLLDTLDTTQVGRVMNPDISTAHTTVQCSGSSFCASFVMGIPLTATGILSRGR